MNNLTYIILTSAEADNIVFGDIRQTSYDTLRWSLDRTKTIVKFDGSTPAWLEGKTSYNHSEILAIVNNPDEGWYSEPEF